MPDRPRNLVNYDPTPAKIDVAALARLCPKCLGQRGIYRGWREWETCSMCDGTGKRKAADV